MEKVRCPNCRGAKIVAKLGGMMGSCNRCEGKGTILQEILPIVDQVVETVEAASSEVIDAVASVNTVVQEVESSAVAAKRKIFTKKKGDRL